MSLELESISVAFGGFKALDDVTISLKKAEIVGLIGPNGAGKTTCVNIITGFQDPTSGTVMLDGQDINAKAPYDIRRRGLARTFASPFLANESDPISTGFAGIIASSLLYSLNSWPASGSSRPDTCSVSLTIRLGRSIPAKFGPC
ncbi:ABC transporter [Primorskyibacter flagellatus]|uniref:ABC transporter n=1 Tax=Primorskyibacter flagellatus TaxID=1387277 RepID=A0A1W2DLT5_9RHOB|nr:ABC transporter [Primorskyibacter flagellatus]